MKPKSIWKKDMMVRIVHPELFLRCGYPLDLKGETQRIIEWEGNIIADFLKDRGVILNGNDYTNDDRRWHKAVKKIANAIAYERIGQYGMGGRERTIHTLGCPGMRGEIVRVMGWKFVNTGKWFPAVHSTNYEGEHDYEPGGLDNQKQHRILELSHGVQCYVNNEYHYLDRIEACHVEPVDDTK